MIVLLVLLVVLAAVAVEAVAVYRDRRRPTLPDRIRKLERDLGIGVEPEPKWERLAPLGVTPTNFTQIVGRPPSFATAASSMSVTPLAVIAHKLRLEEELFFGPGAKWLVDDPRDVTVWPFSNPRDVVVVG